MKIARKFVAIAVSTLMMFSIAGMNVFAASTTQDGLEVSLTTDKDAYSKDEKITATLSVKNTNSTDITDVAMETVIPDGYEVADGTKNNNQLDKLAPNESAELKVVYVAEDSGEDSEDSEDSIVDPSNDSPKTGDNAILPVAIAVVLLISVSLAVLCFKSKKGRKLLSVILTVSIVGGTSALITVNTNATDDGFISINTSIKLNGSNTILSAKVYYGLSNSNTEDYGEIYSYPIEEEHIHETTDGTMYIDNEILVVVKDGVTKQQVDELAKKYDSVVVGAITVSGDYQLKLNTIVSDDKLNEIVEDIGTESIIDSCTLNYVEVYSSDSIEQYAGFYYGKEWESDLQNNTDVQGKSWGIEAINTFGAWKQLSDNSDKVNPVNVGVVDGGFDSSHNDLGYKELFYEDGKNNVSSTSEGKNHGTHVSGTFAANTNDNTGICGVYPYGKDNIYAVSSSNVRKYSENGGWLTSIMHEKISYAELIVRNVKVINQSQGFNWYLNKFSKKDSNGNTLIDYNALNTWMKTYNFDQEKKEAKIYADFLNRMLLKDYDFVIISAAGNDSDQSIGHLESGYMSWNNIISRTDYPDVYDRIIVVGSVNDQFNISSFSNSGTRVDIFAPGESIYSTYCFDEKNLVSKPYEYLSGTSMASPHVAGVAAMVWSANNNLTGAQVKEIVCKDSNKNNRCTSCKMVDANLAVQDSFRTKGAKTSTDPDSDKVIAMGFVLDEDTQAAIVNKKVDFRKNSSSTVYTAVTDKNGHYEINLPKGEYSVLAEIEGYKSFSRTISIKDSGVNYLDKIFLKKLWKYSITVTDKNDILLDGVEVTLWDSNGNKCAEGKTVTGKCSFEIENSPNTKYYLWLTKEGYVWLQLQAFEITSNENITFQLESENITGKVLTEDNKPIENAKIEVYALSEGISVKATEDEYFTNSESEFSIAMPQGDYLLVVTCDGYESVNIDVTVEKNRTNRVSDIHLKKKKTDASIPSDAFNYNGHSYYIYSGNAETWEEAKDYCESLGGYLAVVNDEAENTALYNYMKSCGYQSAYFGYSDSETEGVWKWVSNDTSNYTNWASGEPNQERTTEDYAMFYFKYTDGKWNDGDFNGRTVQDTSAFICEWDSVDNGNKTIYLEQLAIKESDQYNDNEGDSFVFPIGKHRFTRGNTDINGVSYEHGIEGWIARWNYTAESSWAYSVFDLSGKYSSLNGRCVLIQSANTTDFDTTLDFIGDGNLIKSYHLTPDAIPFDINLNVLGVKDLKVYFHDNAAKKSGTSFGLVNMELKTTNSTDEPNIDWKAIYKKKLNETFQEWSSTGSAGTAKYELVDIDQNGIPELFISPAEFRVAACELYTISDGDLKQLQVSSMYGGLHYNSKEKIIGDVHVYNFGSSVFYWVAKLENGNIKEIYSSDAHGDTFTVNGENVTLEEYNAANAKYPIQSGEDWKFVGRKYSLNNVQEISTVIDNY